MYQIRPGTHVQHERFFSFKRLNRVQRKMFFTRFSVVIRLRYRYARGTTCYARQVSEYSMLKNENND